MKNESPTILVIFGITGDLARRYLLPAIDAIGQAQMLPQKFKIVGITRQKDSQFYQMDTEKIEDYQGLDKYLEEIEKSFGIPAQRVFYLSVPPEASKSIIELLGQSGLSKKGESKLLLEKPFGTNLENAGDLARHIDKYFSPEQVYRVDHYMAKETAQNIIVFRSGNSLFKKTWNKDFIKSIEIIASEAIDIEGRANFYEQTGALRDYVQSHLLQLAALTLMELPEDLNDVPKLREKALKNLNIVCDITQKECVKRGQYEGYRNEVKNPNSLVETFVSVNLHSNDPNWSGVPITLVTGKALEKRFTEIKIRYKRDKENESNELILRIQPDAGIEFSIWTKVPGYERKITPHYLSFKLKDHYSVLPEAYEQVLYDAINGEHSLFTGSGEILETWRILDAVQETWKNQKDDLVIYKKGSTLYEVMNM